MVQASKKKSLRLGMQSYEKYNQETFLDRPFVKYTLVIIDKGLVALYKLSDFIQRGSNVCVGTAIPSHCNPYFC